jgi:hypothetical protein
VGLEAGDIAVLNWSRAISLSTALVLRRDICALLCNSCILCIKHGHYCFAFLAMKSAIREMILSRKAALILL